MKKLSRCILKIAFFSRMNYEAMKWFFGKKQVTQGNIAVQISEENEYISIVRLMSQW